MQDLFTDPFNVASGLVSGCGAFVAALILIVVGLVAVGKRHKLGGYLTAGAGALQFAGSCCTSWQGPAIAWGGLIGVVDSVGNLSAYAGLFAWMLSIGVLVGAGVKVSQDVLAQQSSGGEA